MLMIEATVNDQSEIVDEIVSTIPECEVIEVESFGVESLIQVFISLTAIISPYANSIISRLLDNDRCTVKYKDFEYTGRIKNVEELIKKIRGFYPDDVN